jgi:hypothetical protein
MLRLANSVFLTTPIIWDYKVTVQKPCVQAKALLFSTSPTGIIGYFEPEITSIKDLTFLKTVNFFTFKSGSGHNFNV